MTKKRITCRKCGGYKYVTTAPMARPKPTRTKRVVEQPDPPPSMFDAIRALRNGAPKLLPKPSPPRRASRGGKHIEYADPPPSMVAAIRAFRGAGR